jgi:hypothetical protein
LGSAPRPSAVAECPVARYPAHGRLMGGAQSRSAMLAVSRMLAH